MTKIANLKFLVVDDDPNMRSHLVSLLKKNSVNNILQTDNVEQAKLILQQEFDKAEPIDCILCDHHMPNNTGLDFITFVRMSMKFRQVIFITVTSDSERSVVLPYIAGGADSFIVKPAQEKDLILKISQTLAARDSARES